MELPTISGAAYSTSVVEPFDARPRKPADVHAQLQANAKAQGLQLGEPRRLQASPVQAYVDSETQKVKPAMPTPVRIVKVFIADTDERLPLNKRVLHTGEEQLTDLTDQELFFEVPIAELLKTHNALRMQTIDKKAAAKSDHEVFLEPVRIRDLKMVVVTVASFV
jgi:hypothetical protein